MSRENSANDMSAPSPIDLPPTMSGISGNAEAGPSTFIKAKTANSKHTRPNRPTLTVGTKRTTSYSAQRVASPILSPNSPINREHGLAGSDTGNEVRRGLKRRISTPSMANSPVDPSGSSTAYGVSKAVVSKGGEGDDMEGVAIAQGQGRKEVQSRGRSTSTSIVLPSSLEVTTPTIAVPTLPGRPSTGRIPSSGIVTRSSAAPGPGISVIPSTPDVSDEEGSIAAYPQPAPRFNIKRVDEVLLPTISSTPLLERAYTAVNHSLRNVTSFFRHSTPAHNDTYHPLQRRGSDDSEKGLQFDDALYVDSPVARASVDESEAPSSSTTTSSAGPFKHRSGRYWGIWASEEKALGDATGRAGQRRGSDDGYFSLPPTPPDSDQGTPADAKAFEQALFQANKTFATLPTPAISAHSLSKGTSRYQGRRGSVQPSVTEGWLRSVLTRWTRWAAGSSEKASSGRTGRSGESKTAAVIRDLGWTVGVLVLGFFVSLGLVFYLLRSLPITTLRHLPKSTTDVQLLSAEIRAYMASSDVGWWHTIGVLTLVGCWKHSWSVPGAIVLNILVGSILKPIPALVLLTIITATGSLGSYLLSRPLAPLIAVIFPKPLALVRAALAPESAPPPVLHHQQYTDASAAEKVTPIHLTSDPVAPPISGPAAKPNVWRRLLVMRAMGLVPWSGMNVACGVVGVDWKTFWLTTALGSASWSYTTASIGDILSRLAIGESTSSAYTNGASGGIIGTGGISEGEMQGESLTAMLRDPVLIAKLVFLTALTLIPVFFKGKSSSGTTSVPITPSSLASSVYSGTTNSTETSPRTSLGSDGDYHEKIRIMDQSDDALTPSSTLSQSLARFTPTPAVFDVLSFGRTLVRTGVGAVGGGLRHTAGSAARLFGGMA